MSKSLLGEKGQAVLEYVLMVLVAISIVAILATGFRRSLLRIWQFMIRTVSSACPGCQPDPRYRFR